MGVESGLGVQNCFVAISTRCAGLNNSLFFFLECQSYEVLSNADREVTSYASPALCDNTLGPAWFRFQGDAKSKMPTSCVPTHRCGTHAPGWLNGAHPEEHEGKVTRQVCFH